MTTPPSPQEPAREPSAGASPVPPDGGTPGSSEVVRALLGRVQRQLLLSTSVIAIVGLVGGYLIDAWTGALGALLGVGAALLFSGTTVVSMRIAAGRSIGSLAAIVLGSWLAKMAVLVVMLAVLDSATFFNRYVFVVVLFAVVITSMVIDVRAVVQARIPNAETRPGSEPM
jgi:hypothetical protein